MGDAVAVLALLLASSAQIKPHAPLPRPDDSIIAVRQGCRVGQSLVVRGDALIPFRAVTSSS